MKTYSARLRDIEKKWWLIDAQDLVLGKCAVAIADLLRGKNKTTFTPHMDCGDHVIVINADKIFLSGKKLSQKRYYWHTGHPGGIKFRTAGDILSGKFPDRVLHKAIERMITRGPLGRAQMKHLYLYNGDEHPHIGQKPELLDLAAINSKNKKSL